MGANEVKHFLMRLTNERVRQGDELWVLDLADGGLVWELHVRA